MNLSSEIRKVIKKTLPSNVAYKLLKWVTLLTVRFYQNKFGHVIFIRKDTSDINVFAEIFLFRDYNNKLPVVNPKTIVDAGANVGFATLWFHHKYPNAYIIAVEPEFSNFQLLSSNTRSINNITLLNKGLWHKNTHLEIINKNGSKYGFITRENTSATSGSIETCTLENIYDLFKEQDYQTIDILKIDIEGAENRLFSANYDSWLKNVKIIIIELHEQISPGCTDVFLKVLDRYNFELFLEKGENFVYVNQNLI